ncbi:hypothetical protein C7H84_35430 [Burkholderia sp. Nafp2/4-1b]|nr:hypothetical protein C7H84_35430 [Burkholderia sp. Nafp2/4-1b]
MANSDYKTLKAQLSALQEKTEAARIAELEAIVTDIREKVAEFGITSEQIFGRQRAGKKAEGRLAAKYQNIKTGETWSGRGRAPAWIKDVKDRSRFLIGSATEKQADANTAETRAAAKKPTAKGRKVSAKSMKSRGATVAGKKARASTSAAAKKTGPRRTAGARKTTGSPVKSEVMADAPSE